MLLSEILASLSSNILYATCIVEFMFTKLEKYLVRQRACRPIMFNE